MTATTKRTPKPTIAKNSASDGIMNMMSIAVEKGIDVDKLSGMMDLYERNNAMNSKKEINKALSVFQSELPIIAENGYVSFNQTKYNYALISDIAKAIQPLLSKHCLSYHFEYDTSVANLVKVSCTVTHESGGERSSSLSAPPDFSGKKDAVKAVLSTIQYLRRHTLLGAFGIIVGGEDDDLGSSNLTKEQYESEQYQAVALYPDVEFQKNLPKWTKLIQDGKQTSEDIIANSKKAGVNLSSLQEQDLNAVNFIEQGV